MSTFVERQVRCPGCGRGAPRQIARGLNLGRAPRHRAAILAAAFQRFRCAPCAREFVVEEPFSCLDFERRLWLAVFPTGWAARWRSLERAPLESHRRNLASDDASAIARSLAEGWRIRAVFGLPALREKLLLDAHGIDDAHVELLKLTLILGGRLPLSPGAPAQVTEVTAERLVLWHRDGALSVELGGLKAFAGPEYAELLREVSAGPFVDARRLVSADDLEEEVPLG